MSLGAVLSRASRDFGLVHVAGAEVEIGQSVVQLRRVGVGVDRVLVLVDGQPRGIGVAILKGFVFIDIGQCQGDSRPRRGLAWGFQASCAGRTGTGVCVKPTGRAGSRCEQLCLL
jgi:hypothetical protein